ncbi:hypothetical protein CJ030_MR5G011887 [Morella rubra]|uniref:Uncharacterized protein n=1 Tax=Morella rubra TaxID=262757 RepID=A0A6A1VLI6_9ROSI|nr:hypothetical protein CJ030_MR5G011887 [Morella rubra]
MHRRGSANPPPNVDVELWPKMCDLWDDEKYKRNMDSFGEEQEIYQLKQQDDMAQLMLMCKEYKERCEMRDSQVQMLLSRLSSQDDGE